MPKTHVTSLPLALVALTLSLAPARAEDKPDCKDFAARHKAMIAAVDARAPGLETDRLREKADAYLKDCVEDDDRLAAEQPCKMEDGRLACR